MKFILTIVGLVVLVAILVAVKIAPGFGQFPKMMEAGAHMQMPPETVTATAAKSEVWENTLHSTGSIVTVQGVTVSAEAGGKVTKISFEAGATVKQGDLLVEIDSSTEEAQLRAAEATAALAEANLARSKDLLDKQAIAKADFDLMEAQSKQAIASADNLRAVIAKKTIRAPFSGKLGLRLVNLGQVLNVGDPIVSLQTVDPIFVNFSLPQQNLETVSTDSSVRIATDAAPDEQFEGKITAVNPDVDPLTRNFRAQATLANPEGKLRPGMFAKVTVVLPTKQKVLAIPTTAVLYAPYGDSVFVVEEEKGQDGKAQKVLRQQFVRLGGARGDFVTVVDGLKEGELVVTSGVFKLRPKMAVVVDNKLAPEPKLDPKPQDT